MSVYSFKELASFTSAGGDVIIWTVQALNGSQEFKTLVAFPKHDEEGYKQVSLVFKEEDALRTHHQWIKRLVFRRRLGIIKA